MNQLKEQKKLRNSLENSTYPSVMQRAGAFLLDSIISFPITIVLLFATRRINTNSNILYSGIIIQLLNCFMLNFYRIFFNVKFNGTPGKLICKFKIISEDGQHITWTAAVKRELIYIIVSIVYLILFYIAFFMNRGEIETFGDATSIYSTSIFHNINTILMFIIYILDFGKAKSSPKRQTLHDKIAKTVVVYKYVN